jgi:hypothetical protein
MAGNATSNIEIWIATLMDLLRAYTGEWSFLI